MQAVYPMRPKDRFEVYRFFNGLAADGQEGLDRRRLRVPLVKSFLLEHVSSAGGRTPRPPNTILQALGVAVTRLDETFMEVREQDPGPTAAGSDRRTVGYVEQFSERFFAYYTSDESQCATKRVNRWITNSPDLDSTWFSSQLLQRLWDTDVSLRGDERFGKLTFKHESIFEMPEDAAEDPDAKDDDNDGEDDDTEDQPDFERRKARFHMADRIGRIKASLSSLQENYAPLHALHALRFPSRVGRGSHDLYQQGRLTNRSESFEEHRNMVRYLYRTYGAMLALTEDTAWHRMDATPARMRTNIGAKGVPLIVRFKEELSPATFRYWVMRAFQKRNPFFRLWGDPIWMGPTKVHVYGADRHLWQPINIEMTAKSLVAILPQGTCGNTFHRLVTNIQAYVCPSIDAWLGSEPFQGLIDNSIAQSGGYADEG